MGELFFQWVINHLGFKTWGQAINFIEIARAIEDDSNWKGFFLNFCFLPLKIDVGCLQLGLGI